MSKQTEERPTYLKENLLAWQGAHPPGLATESFLFTDVNINGVEISCGPFHFLSTLARQEVGITREMKPAIVLRMTYHAKAFRPTTPMISSSAHYHGGDYLDEIAAVCSLLLGCRVCAGPINREFRADGDPMGNPVQYQKKAIPSIFASDMEPKVPRCLSDCTIMSLGSFLHVLQLEPKDLSDYLKACRLYQQALLMAEVNPEYSWILLVSACESIASHDIPGLQSAPSLLRIVNEDLHTFLVNNTSEEVQQRVATEIVSKSKATNKFISFMMTNCPPPPARRPPLGSQVAMADSKLKKALSTIYDHRSKYLHTGVGFPAPMCHSPRFWKDGETSQQGFEEKPGAIAETRGNATWMQAETPMLLSFFEYLVRGCLVNWMCKRVGIEVPNLDERQKMELGYRSSGFG